ncbi:hypothetical protein ACGFI9_31870 [Micromonospora sp. NPDC048930]|uniref:hypothetical protein n=1 Tax=Micromonospora sp. NPDC048930 TaxID=3364261 RepID=UPI00371A9593
MTANRQRPAARQPLRVVIAMPTDNTGDWLLTAAQHAQARGYQIVAVAPLREALFLVLGGTADLVLVTDGWAELTQMIEVIGRTPAPTVPRQQQQRPRDVASVSRPRVIRRPR